jgi:hypothetical protein
MFEYEKKYQEFENQPTDKERIEELEKKVKLLEEQIEEVLKNLW